MRHLYANLTAQDGCPPNPGKLNQAFRDQAITHGAECTGDAVRMRRDVRSALRTVAEFGHTEHVIALGRRGATEAGGNVVYFGKNVPTD
jgi:hypothetical protein